MARRKLEVEGTKVLISPPIYRKYHYKFAHFLQRLAVQKSLT